MVEARLKLEPEVQEIFGHIDANQNFVLSGGAGSGKTYSLVQTIRQAISERPLAGVACITYTNAAVREIANRVSSERLIVSTIHDFLWDNIKSFQGELKAILLQLIADPDEKRFEVIGEPLVVEEIEEIQYKEYTSLRNGIISHEELLVLAENMFRNHPKLCDILKDRYKLILVDEYQDTSPLVVQILIDHLRQSARKNVVGFFGDSMQSIYDDSIGDLKAFVDDDRIKEVKKEQNRRSPRLVYELANKLRNDGIEQKHSDDPNAPNMKNGVVKDGEVRFFYTTGVEKLEAVKILLGWDFSRAKETKELNLTHNQIAPKAGFGELMDIYNSDKILDYRDRIKAYIKANSITDDFSTMTFGEVIAKLLEGKTTEAELKKVNPTDGMKAFIEANPELFETAKSYPWEQFKKLYIDKDSLIDDKKEDSEDTGKSGTKRDRLITHLVKVQENIDLYNAEKYNDFLRRTEFPINSIADKRRIRDVVTELSAMADRSIEEVIEFANNKGICKRDDKLTNFITTNKYLYDRVKRLKFEVFQKLFAYLEGYTSYSTQHKIKGAQFDNVLVVLDNGNWSKYNFQYLFEGNGTESVRNRSSKLFYVCCTRSVEKLAVYFHAPSDETLAKAKELFGEDNVILVA
jgi:DNA helicase-2/ATP-dependent DNA helicase PcrA